jgi:subtilase family serine protease
MQGAAISTALPVTVAMTRALPRFADISRTDRFLSGANVTDQPIQEPVA